MRINNKCKIIAALTAAGIISAALVKPGGTKNDYTNLQVLPKDIAPKDLQRIMVDEFEDGLGVSCNFCHAQEKGSLHLDYASDAKPEKEIARAMMRMTIDINKKYFTVELPVIGDSLMAISCSNCHHGTAHPGLNE